MSRRVQPSLPSRIADQHLREWPSIVRDMAGVPAAQAWDCSASVTSAALCLTHKDDDLSDTYSMAFDLAWVCKWVGCRQVYRIDPVTAEELCTQPMPGEIPSEALRRLPYPIIYVDHAIDYVSDGEAVRFDGFLAQVVDNGAGQSLILALIGGGDRRLRIEVSLDEGKTLNDAVGALELSSGSSGVTMDSFMPDELTVAAMLNLLLFIISGDDVEVAYEPPSGKRGQKVGKRSCPDHVKIAGARIGRAIGEARRAYSANSTHDTGRTVAPHMRRAHWQHFWVGPRKGREDGKPGDELVVRWIPPIAVNGGEDEVETVHSTKRS